MITYKQYLNENLSGKTKQEVLDSFTQDVFAYGETEEDDIFAYAINVVKVPWLEFIDKFTEYFIFESNDCRQMFADGDASSVMGSHSISRFLEDFLPPYYEKVLKQRNYLKKLEDFMLEFKDPYMLYTYAAYTIKERWPEAEFIIAQEKDYAWKQYLSRFSISFSDIDRKKWIKTFPVSSDLIKSFNSVGWGDSPQIRYKIQEYIIRTRPELSGEIKEVDPKIKEKYSHELELSKVDI